MKELRRHPLVPLAAWLILAAALGSVPDGAATEGDMAKLPVSSRFGCRNCHLSADPVPGSSTLNPFGEDFLDHGRVWDADLAALNSDGDGCTNGVELGDADGDGERDENVTEETGNPGEADDCGGGPLIDPSTWGALKALFQR